MALAIEHRHEALAAEIASELAFWASRSGVLETPPANIIGPDARQLTEGWAEIAEHWQALGCPYEAALALLDGDAPAVRRALRILEELGATPVAALAARRLASPDAGDIVRGPR